MPRPKPAAVASRVPGEGARAYVPGEGAPPPPIQGRRGQAIIRRSDPNHRPMTTAELRARARQRGKLGINREAVRQAFARLTARPDAKRRPKTPAAPATPTSEPKK